MPSSSDRFAMHFAQMSMRRWKDGRVVRERFYHK
jgi:hypothetical protein